MNRNTPSNAKNNDTLVTRDKLQFVIHGYDNAVRELVYKVAESFQSIDPFFRNFAIQHTEHSGPTRNVRSPAILDTQQSETSIEATLSVDVLKKCDTEGFAEFLYTFASNGMSAIAPQFFATLNEIIDVSGQSIDAMGQKFTISTYLDAIERIDISFDNNGQPNLPTIYCGSELAEIIKNLAYSEEEKQRESRIIDQKRSEYFAKKRVRRLS